LNFLKKKIISFSQIFQHVSLRERNRNIIALLTSW